MLNGFTHVACFEILPVKEIEEDPMKSFLRISQLKLGDTTDTGQNKLLPSLVMES